MSPARNSGNFHLLKNLPFSLRQYLIGHSQCWKSSVIAPDIRMRRITLTTGALQQHNHSHCPMTSTTSQRLAGLKAASSSHLRVALRKATRRPPVLHLLRQETARRIRHSHRLCSNRSTEYRTPRARRTWAVAHKERRRISRRRYTCHKNSPCSPLSKMSIR